MTCWCCVQRGGAGRANTPYSWHLYDCEYYLSELSNYSYEEFKCDYEKMETENKNCIELYEHFAKLYDKKKARRGRGGNKINIGNWVKYKQFHIA